MIWGATLVAMIPLVFVWWPRMPKTQVEEKQKLDHQRIALALAHTNRLTLKE